MIKRVLLLISVFLLSLFASNYAYSGQKVDPFLGVFHVNNESQMGLKSLRASEVFYEVFIKTNDVALTKEVIADEGGEVRIAVGNIITASLPSSAVEIIENQEEVLFIEAAKPISAHNDLAMVDINGNEVLNGTALPSAFDGSNVIVGIVDTGIDYRHSDFNDANGKSRILYVWDQMSSNGAGPTEINNTYGVECDNSKIANGTCSVEDTTGHGTHITGTAAGRSSTYGGVAPNASIIAVRYKAELEIGNGYANPIFSTTICEGAYYVFKKAEQLGLPAVVNLSLGTHIGPHDGTSLFEECLDSLVEGSSGRAIIAAVGNETSSSSYYTGLHAGYEVSGNFATNFEVKNFSAGRIFYLDIWGDVDSDLSFGLRINAVNQVKDVGGNSDSGMIEMGRTKNGSFLNGQIEYQINTTEDKSPLNGKPHVGILLKFSSNFGDPSDYNFDLLISGYGNFDAWWYPDKPATTVNFTSISGFRNGVNFVPGDREMSVAIPSTAKNVIGVAGYATRNRWENSENCCQVGLSVGDILKFSSIGPSADPSYTGQKPEIAAPGAMIVSAKSRHSKVDNLLLMPDGEHTLMAGTSMAAPFVTGAVALMFSQNPDYTYQDVEQYITQSAYVDDYVDEVPNNRWGYGKLDVLAAIETALNGGASGSASGSPNLALPQSVKSSSSCQFITSGTKKDPAILILWLGTLMAGLVVRRLA